MPATGCKTKSAGVSKREGNSLRGDPGHPCDSQLGVAMQEERPGYRGWEGAPVGTPGSGVPGDLFFAFDTKEQLFLDPEVPASFIASQILTINCFYLKELKSISVPHNLESPLTPRPPGSVSSTEGLTHRSFLRGAHGQRPTRPQTIGAHGSPGQTRTWCEPRVSRQSFETGTKRKGKKIREKGRVAQREGCALGR